MATKTEAMRRAKHFAKMPVERMRSHWKFSRARTVATGIVKAEHFREEVRAMANVLDGRCPDGCCGNEESAPWRPTPAEWTALAEMMAEECEERRFNERERKVG